MGAGWVAGSVRGRLLARHRLGADGARAVASARSVEDAAALLRSSAYADVLAHADSVTGGQHAIWAAVLWDLRVLAGWLPADGVETVRVLAAWFEIGNVEDLLFASADRPFDLGTLETAWTRWRDATVPSESRGVLQRSAWGDPGSDDPAAMVTGLRLAWARRLGAIDASWGAGAAALVVARMIMEHDEPVGLDIARRAPALGRRVAGASTLEELSSALPEAARWVLGDIREASGLWRAEARWWGRLGRDAHGWLRAARPGKPVVVGAVASLMVDAWRTCAALEIATRGGRGREVLDAAA